MGETSVILKTNGATSLPALCGAAVMFEAVDKAEKSKSGEDSCKTYDDKRRTSLVAKRSVLGSPATDAQAWQLEKATKMLKTPSSKAAPLACKVCDGCEKHRRRRCLQSQNVFERRKTAQKPFEECGKPQLFNVKQRAKRFTNST